MFSVFCQLLCVAGLGFLGLLTNFVFPWAFTDFIRLPRPNYFKLILGIYGLAINPLLFLLALLWACRDPFLLFFHIIHCPWVCYLLFLSFLALLSPFAFSRPIYLFHGPVIHYFYCLDLMVFVLCLLPTSFWSVLLGWASFLSFGFHKKKTLNKYILTYIFIHHTLVFVPYIFNHHTMFFISIIFRGFLFVCLFFKFFL